jgi:hypothetical protein
VDPFFNLAILYLDLEPDGLDTIERFKTSISFFEKYKDKGGKDDRVAQYLKDAQKGIEKEERRREREKRDQLRKAQKAEEEKKLAAEAAAKPTPVPTPATPPPSSGKLSSDDK